MHRSNHDSSAVYANYVLWGGGSSELVDDFLMVKWDQNGKGQFFVGEWQCNVGLRYRKTVAL